MCCYCAKYFIITPLNLHNNPIKKILGFWFLFDFFRQLRFQTFINMFKVKQNVKSGPFAPKARALTAYIMLPSFVIGQH